MDIREFLDSIRELADPEWAEEWDNTGLMVGSSSWRVSKVAVSLDAQENTIDEAVRNGCDLLVTHHPLIFSPLSRLDQSDLSSKLVFKAIEKHLGIVSMHTNWDVSPMGVNVCLSETISLTRISPLIPGSGGSWGMGASGFLESPISMEVLARKIKAKWGLSWVRAYGNPSGNDVRKIALCGGSGGDLWRLAMEKGADLYITADMKYHQILEACSMGMRIVVVDHGEMEKVSIPVLAHLISERTRIPVKLIDGAGPACMVFSS